MNLKTKTDIAELLDIQPPNVTKFVDENLQVTAHEVNGKVKNLIDIDIPKNKRAINDYIEINRDGVSYRGEVFTRKSKKAIKQNPTSSNGQNVPRETIEPKKQQPKKEVKTAQSIMSKSTTIKPNSKTKTTDTIKTTSDGELNPSLPAERLILEFSEALSPLKIKKYEKILTELNTLGIALIPEFEAQGVIAYTNLQAKRADVEKKRSEKQKIEIQISKEEGKTLPTDLTKMAWDKYGDAAMISFKQAGELLVNSFALENNISNDDRSKFLNQLNEATFDGVEEQKRMGLQLIEQFVKDQTGISIEKKN